MSNTVALLRTVKSSWRIVRSVQTVSVANDPYSEHIRSVHLIMNLDIYVYYIHFEITGDPCNLIGIQQGDLFPNRTIFRALDLIIFRSMVSKK